MNVPLAGETLKAYYTRQERHWTSLAAAALPAEDSSDDDLSDKQQERKENERNKALKKKGKELAELAFKEATESNK